MQDDILRGWVACGYNWRTSDTVQRYGISSTLRTSVRATPDCLFGIGWHLIASQKRQNY